MLVLQGFVHFLLACLVALLLAKATELLIQQDVSFGDILPFCAILTVVVLARTGVSYVFERYFRSSALRIKNRMLSDYCHGLLASGPTLTEERDSGGKAVSVCEAADAAEPYFFEYLPAFFHLVVSLPLLLLVVFASDPISALIMLVTGPMLPFFLYLIGKESERANRERMKSLTRLGGSLFDAVSGMRTISLFSKQEAFRNKVAQNSEAFRKETMQVLRVSFLSAFVLELAAAISTAIIAVTLATRLIAGSITYFPCFFVLLLTPEYFLAIRRFGAKFHVAQKAKAAAVLLAATLREVEEVVVQREQTTVAQAFDENPVSLEIRNLSFSYRPPVPTLKDVNLCVTAGGYSVLAGKSGAGKSTLASCVLRFLTPRTGEILLNGRDLCAVEAAEARRLLAYVPQRPYLFTDTLENNLLLARPDASREELADVIRQACLEDLVEKLPMGLNTELSELGSDLSAGERQRIGIARALLKHAPVVLIDEAVSAQDLAREVQLNQAFYNLSKERAVLIIAHHLDTLKDAAEIYVMREGSIVQRGTHEALLASSGDYRDLVCAWETA